MRAVIDSYECKEILQLTRHLEGSAVCSQICWRFPGGGTLYEGGSCEIANLANLTESEPNHLNNDCDMKEI